MKKTIFMTILILVLVLSLGGCGREKSQNSNSDSTQLKPAKELTTDLVDEESVDATENEASSSTADETNSTTTSKDYVQNLSQASTANQLLIVAASGSSAEVSLHSKNADGLWVQDYSCQAKIGKNGIGKTKEGDAKTPKGTFHFTKAFGIKDNPGCSFEYTKVDGSYYWVDDSNSSHYNQMVSTNQVACDWNSAESLANSGSSYNYALALNYNEACVPGAGSAIFMHCQPTGGAGCIAVPESDMKWLLNHIQSDCVVVIDYKDNFNI